MYERHRPLPKMWAPYKHPFQWNCRVLPDMR
nr:MAG TPA: hypothetical protein [Caudoviricetes sp.]